MCASDVSCFRDGVLSVRRLKHTRWGLILVAASALGMLLPVTGAHARSVQQSLTIFSGEQALKSSELAKLRGGFYWDGTLVNVGFSVQQFVNNIQVTNIHQDLGSGPITITKSENDGKTNLSVTISNSGAQTLIQNSANNQSIQSITTMNIATQGATAHLQNFIIGQNIIHIFQNSAGYIH